MKISTYSVSELGHSHIEENKVCQDYSLNYSAPDNSLFIAIVSDGHGSKTYCRSDRGSQFACKIAMEAMKGLKMNDLIKGRAAQVPVRKQSNKSVGDLSIPKFEDVYPKIKDIDQSFEHLFQYIYSQWLQKVELVWFPYGDGKLLACDEQGKWFEPILWDADCFLNVTTSLCQKEAYKSFRYSFSGKGDFPVAVMLGTDGIDDSWGDKLPAYYTSILEDISNEGVEKAQRSLKKSLPDLSRNGSGDDVSVAWIVDENAIASVLPKLKMADVKQENEILSVRNKQLDELLKRKNEEQNIDKNKYKSDIISLNKEIETAKEKINLCQTKIQQLEQKNKELESDNKKFKAEIDKHLSYKKKLVELCRKSPQDNVDVNNLDNYILSLQNEVSKFSKSLKDAESKIKTLKQQVKDKDNLSEDTVTDIKKVDDTEGRGEKKDKSID
jgi:hypothetical protein